jgi:hypothetical protein
MKLTNWRGFRAPLIKATLFLGAAVVGLTAAQAQSKDPIRIGAPFSATPVRGLFPEFRLHATHQPGAYSRPVEASDHSAL